VDEFKVDQPRAVSFLIIHNVLHARIAMRPRAGKLIAPELMSPAIFAGRCFQHLPSQCTTIHVFPQAFTRQLVDANCLSAGITSAKSISVQHFKTLHFPALPVFGVTPKTDRYA